MKKALTIGGSDSSGGAGIQADLKTFAALGVYGTSAITSVTAQNFKGIQGIVDLHPEFVALQIESVISNIKVDSIKIGMLSNEKLINSVAEKLRKLKLKNIILDPVLYAKGGTPLLNPAAKNILIKKMFPRVLLVTPNIPEAQLLTGIIIRNYSDIKKAAKEIYKLGAKNVLIKGGHFRGKATDTLFNGRSFRFFEAERLENKIVHGTGCALASAITAELAKGTSLVESVERAKLFITSSIINSINPGRGNSAINHFGDLIKESEKYRMLSEMETALDILENKEIGCLIPEVQSNLGYGREEAKSKDDIIAFPERIIKKGAGITTIDRPRFGGSSHIAAIILTAMAHDPSKKSAMNIKYSPKLVSVCKKIKLSVSSFSRSSEPKLIKGKKSRSMEWGTDQAIKKFGSVPDIIYDTGGVGKEPMIRVLGPDPLSIANTILKIKTGFMKRRRAATKQSSTIKRHKIRR